ncbi:hypothetical protein [Candidatus Villigracilis affinis]|uniref:hypothetical protein n=1 Tax=Candidatus Villigracilis affinis TaxID=3140682 RepID=UPI002A214A83|nr:toll/interleukin-1 receptor domain-containing protein [Anaerolineales bacterium]
MTNRPLRVFLCHSSNDKPAVRELYQKLRAEPWIQPWLAQKKNQILIRMKIENKMQ